MKNLMELSPEKKKDINSAFEQAVGFFESKNPFLNLPEEEKLIVLVDIVGFSQSDTRTQLMNISLFQHYILGFMVSEKFLFKNKVNISSFIPTGDGCYILADKCDVEVALDFLETMIGGFQKVSNSAKRPMALRASALIGNCVPFLDLAHHKNYIGEGMNEAARILSCGTEILEKQYMETHNATEIEAKLFSQNSLFIGDNLFNQQKLDESNAEQIFHFEQVPDKHGKKRNITVLQGIKELDIGDK